MGPVGKGGDGLRLSLPSGTCHAAQTQRTSNFLRVPGFSVLLRFHSGSEVLRGLRDLGLGVTSWNGTRWDLDREV